MTFFQALNATKKNEPDLFDLWQTLQTKVLIYNSALKTKKIRSYQNNTYI